MAHGYLGDGYGTHGEFDPDRGDERHRERRERNWRGRDQDWSNRGSNRGAIFSDWDRARSNDERWSADDWRGQRSGSSRFESELASGRRSFSSNPDDHYRSWRDRHMSELDRDYADYCRDREQQFHSEFDEWRRQRHASPQPLRTGMTQSGLSADPTGVTQAEAETSPESLEEENPMATATLGTTSSSKGRGRR